MHAEQLDAEKLESLRFPIGRFDLAKKVTAREVETSLERIRALPGALRAALHGLSERQLATPYRPGGWTVRQVAHHIADSQMNGYVRIRLALTEDTPTIKPYDEARWAELVDAACGPLEPSLALLDALNQRSLPLFDAFTPRELEREFHHPEHACALRVDTALALYAWHGDHHTAHITRLREREGW